MGIDGSIFSADSADSSKAQCRGQRVHARLLQRGLKAMGINLGPISGGLNSETATQL